MKRAIVLDLSDARDREYLESRLSRQDLTANGCAWKRAQEPWAHQAWNDSSAEDWGDMFALYELYQARYFAGPWPTKIGTEK